MENVWLDGMMGLIIGDALGVPVQFLSRKEIARRPQGLVKGMEGYGTYNMPKGTWSDDGSMALATLDSIFTRSKIDPEDIMKRFVNWELKGHYTQYGRAFDQGITCSNAIYNYINGVVVEECGMTGERSNGNGSLMRILPACIFCGLKELKREENVGKSVTDKGEVGENIGETINVGKSVELEDIHKVSGLTHNHLRSKIACGIYYYIVKEILAWRMKGKPGNDEDTLFKLLQKGIDEALKKYGADKENINELAYYNRILTLAKFKETNERDIRSSGYVVDTLEAALWCLITTSSYEECLLKVVNLGDDTDTVAAVAGGLAGLYYGVKGIPKEWIECVSDREMIEEFFEEVHLRMLANI